LTSPLPKVFGSQSITFPTKRAAKIFAAKAAYEYLLSVGIVGPDQYVNAKSISSLGSVSGLSDEGMDETGGPSKLRKLDESFGQGMTYTQRVNGLLPSFLPLSYSVIDITR
jgi:hypothetical protein